jgi:hypothetical protein
MSPTDPVDFITPQQYLNTQLSNEIKHEYVIIEQFVPLDKKRHGVLSTAT